MPSHAIIVENEEEKQTCLIDIPFSPAFAPVKRAIVLAASQLQLKPHHFLAGDIFTEKIILETRSARLVVAVCTPDARVGGIPNPNVMYELGLARAIGKPILLMTTDGNALPADLRDVTALQYTATDVKRPDDFARKIKEKMEELLQESPNGITDKRAKVWVTQAKHRMLLTPEFWTSFNIVFRYANAVRHEAESVYWDHGHDIARHGNEMLGRSVYDSRPFWQAWGGYLQRYQQLHNVLIVPAGFADCLRAMDRQSRISSARDQPAGQPIEANPASCRQIKLIRDFSHLLQRRVADFEEKHREATKVCNDLRTATSSEELMNCFNVTTPDLVLVLKELIRCANGLVNNLVTLLADGFEPVESSTNAVAA